MGDHPVIDKLIESWTQETRTEIHGALTKLHVGAVKIDATTNTWCMPLVGEIPARSTQSVTARGYVQLRQMKLFILEPQFEQIEREVILETVAAKIEKTWFRTRIIEPQVTRTRTIEHKRVVHVPRAIWRVRGMFVGSSVQFPLEKDIAGDLFGPEGVLSLPGIVEPGLDVTVQVENITDQKMPFYAAVLGRLAEQTTAIPSAETVSPS